MQIPTRRFATTAFVVVFFAGAIGATVMAQTADTPRSASIVRLLPPLNCQGDLVLRIEPYWWTEPLTKPATPREGLDYYLENSPDLAHLSANDYAVETVLLPDGVDGVLLVQKDWAGALKSSVLMGTLGDSWIVDNAAICPELVQGDAS